MADINQLFGDAADFDNSYFRIPRDRLIEMGLDDPENSSGEEIFAAIVKGAYERFFKLNTNEAVQAAMDKSIYAPFTRNEIERTQFAYTCQFFGSYTAPDFDPDDL
jgi:hypothetical protein